MKLRSFILAGFLFVSLPFAKSFAQVAFSVGWAPPPLPVVVQPACPVAGYIWTPGYWGWDDYYYDYYWVPGVWVPPPRVGLLWTPGWWGWNNGVYVFNQGYWGPTVGFYGGINYGFGYTGDGYWGGRWSGNTFQYNTAVTRVNTNVVRSTYVDQSVNRQVNTSRAAFNGPNGVKAEPTAQQKAAAANANKVGPTSQQLNRQQAASKDENLRASVNKGKPNQEAIKSFNKAERAGQGKRAQEVGAAGEAAGAGAGNRPGNLAERQGQGPGAGTGKGRNEPGNVANRKGESAGTGAGKAKNKRGKVSKQHGQGAGNAEARGKTRNVDRNKPKASSDKTAKKHQAPTSGHHEMTQKSRHPQMGAAGPKGGGNRGYATAQQKGKKGQGKKEEGKKKQGRP